MSETDPLTPEGQTLSTQPSTQGGTRDVGDYDLLEVIGRGGMGEVVLARDRKIGREVALKRMRGDHPPPELVDRFLREAKIQARLDHPAIAPVHELGFDSDGLPFFTMKRVAGTTLAELLEQRAERPQRLLRALVDVCRAIELAHARRIVHRDLKPSNIMLGDYGEVYVLDWGVARVLGGERMISSPVGGEVASLDGLTKAGALLGTPGYMAPEQARGEPAETPADIYALGAILFEILAEAPLHPRGREALATTIENAERSPAQRRKDGSVPPELDAICAAALATDPAERPTARQLADGIQGYLDGDRDVERRRALASELGARAQAAFASGDYAHAMRSAGRALALDPVSTAAAKLVTSVIHDPPAVPAEVARQLDADEARMVRERSRRAIAPNAGIFLLVPVLPFLHVVDWPTLVAMFATFALVILLSWLNVKIGVPFGVTLIGHALTAVALARLLGPFLVTPILLCGNLLSATSIPWLARRWWAAALATLVIVLLPFVVEWVGLLPPTWTMTPDGLLSFGTVFAPAHLQPSVIVAGHVAAMLVLAAYARRIGRDRADAQRRLSVQAWHLGNLLPKER